MNIKKFNEKLSAHLDKVKKWFGKDTRQCKSETVLLKRKKKSEPKILSHRLEGLPKLPGYNKSILRILTRTRKKVRNPVRPSNKVFYDQSKKNAYCMFSDGSYHKVLQTGKRRLIPV